MTIAEIASHLESIAPLSLQEDYDNSGLLTGSAEWQCTGILCTLDVTEAVIDEAKRKNCNLVIAHHPVIFRGLKRLTGSNEVERIVISAIRNEIAIYAAHTNLDNIIDGVNGRIARELSLRNVRILSPKRGLLQKLFTFVPPAHLERIRDALFAAGGGNISNYTECSFTHEGTGTFKPGEGTHPFSGEQGLRRNEQEIKLELIFPAYRQSKILKALFASHPYEEVAYDVVQLANEHQQTGSGVIGEIDDLSEREFLSKLQIFNAESIRHTPLLNKPIKKVAVCGGTGSFLLPAALQAGADAYVTADVKYHEFSGADGRILFCDIGHFESEQFTIDLLIEILERKFRNFAVLKSEIRTNPVHYFPGNQTKTS